MSMNISGNNRPQTNYDAASSTDKPGPREEAQALSGSGGATQLTGGLTQSLTGGLTSSNVPPGKLPPMRDPVDGGQGRINGDGLMEPPNPKGDGLIPPTPPGKEYYQPNDVADGRGA